MRDLGSSRKANSASGAGPVKREALVGSAGSADMLFRQKAIGAAADDFCDRLEWGDRRQPLRHDGGPARFRSLEGPRRVWKGALPTEPHPGIGGTPQFVGSCPQRTIQTDTRRS